jgi:hypothetical protein
MAIRSMIAFALCVYIIAALWGMLKIQHLESELAMYKDIAYDKHMTMRSLKRLLNMCEHDRPLFEQTCAHDRAYDLKHGTGTARDWKHGAKCSDCDQGMVGHKFYNK